MAFQSQIDLSDSNNSGATVDNTLTYDLKQALNQFSRYIVGAGTLTVQLNITSTAENREDGGPTTSYYVGQSGNTYIYGPSSLYELTNGTHVSGASTDITINVSPSYLSNLDLSRPMGYYDTPAANTYNPVVVFMHELMHGFGQTGYYDQSGNLQYNSGFYYKSTFDADIQKNQDGSAYFVGPNAEAAEGGPVRLTTSSEYGENYYHFGNTTSDINATPATAQDPLTLDLMNGIVFYYDYRYPVSRLDLGVLKDLGYHVLNPASSGADFSGNGSSGVLLKDGQGSLIDWVVQNGGYQGYHVAGNTNGYSVVGTGDFNADGASDVLFSNGSGTIADWTLQNGSFQTGAILGNSNGYTVAGTGDFNGDGTSDVLFSNASGAVAEWLVGNNTVQAGAVVGNANGYGVVGTGDYSGDGTTDVLLQNGGGTVIDWLMQNGAYQSYHTVGNLSGYGVVGQGDFNGDGTTDVLLENAAGNVIDWMLQNGQYAGYNQVGNAAGYGIVATGDYNGDGITDVLLENSSRNVIDWTMSNGTYAGYSNIGNAGNYSVQRT